MHRSLVTVLVAAAACGASPPPPAPVYGNTPPAGGQPVTPPAEAALEVEITRMVGDFDRAILRRLLRTHAETCRQRGAGGVVTLELMLTDRPDRRGLRIVSAAGDAALRGCLGEVLPAAAWPTGRLDGVVTFTATVRVAR
ncbi:MAG: hypothetical protein IPL61_36505 [Myxococcales bacterium]|nr:hypothetical protein [Myxococcales bacterium]